MSIYKIKRYHQALQACRVAVRKLESMRLEVEEVRLPGGLVQLMLKVSFDG